MPATLAVDRLRRRKRPSGISGEETRVSMTMNETNRTIATAKRSSVVPDVQPSAFPFTIA